MVGNFFSICFLSVLIGIGFGIIVTLIFKYCRFINNSAITETSLIIVFGFTSYYISEVANQSGVICLLTAGILFSHYTNYNMSQTGKIVTGATLQIVSQIVEAFLFIYLGISLWTYFSESVYKFVSWNFIGLSFMSVFVARIACIYGSSFLFYIFMR
jgi:solute carrier family 9 (sodium/hydrogen exchanger), member 6/7